MTDMNNKIELLVEAIQRDAKPVNNWFELGGIMMSHLAWDALFNLFSDRETLFQDGLKLYSDLLMSHEAALSPHILAIYMNYEIEDVSSGYEAFLLYMSAACKISLGHVEEGRAIFRRLAKIIEADLTLGEGLPHLYGLDKLEKQLFTSEEIDGFLADEIEPNRLDIHWPTKSDFVPDAPVLFAACDPVYFDKFSNQFIDVFNSFGHIHLHVVGGNINELTKSLSNREGAGVSFSVEDFAEGHGSPYYACARFLQSSSVVKGFNKDLIILDIDVAAQDNFKSFIHEAKDTDVTLFRDITLVPWLKHRAAAIYIKNNNNGQQYLRSLAVVLKEALKAPAWFVDQSVLHCVNQYWENSKLAVSLRYLEQKDGYILDDMITSSGDLMEKRQMRTNTGFVK